MALKMLRIEYSEPIEMTALGNRFYKLTKPHSVNFVVEDLDRDEIYTIRATYLAGFITNFRSGSPLVDFFIDQIGNQDMQELYLFHDAAYTPNALLDGEPEHIVPKSKADEILRAGIVLALDKNPKRWKWANRVKARTVKLAVTLFGGSAYRDDDAVTNKNSELFTITFKPFIQKILFVLP